MKHLFFSILLFGLAQSSYGSLLVHLNQGCGFFIDAAVEGIYVDEPGIGFYGLVTPENTPAVIYDPNYLTARVNGTVGATWPANRHFQCFGDQLYTYVSTSFFQCSQKQSKDLNEGSDIQLFSINGDGTGAIIPATQEGFFDARLLESHTEAMLASTHYLSYGFDLFWAVGFGFIYRHQEFKSNLQNTAMTFDNGTISEIMNTYYRGVKFELGVIKSFCNCWTLSFIPTCGIYAAHTDLDGNQTWGMLAFDPVSISRVGERTAFQVSLRSDLLYNWCGYYFGGKAFVDYLSYAPTIVNPRAEDDMFSRISAKCSFRYGGGLVAGKLF